MSLKIQMMTKIILSTWHFYYLDLYKVLKSEKIMKANKISWYFLLTAVFITAFLITASNQIPTADENDNFYLSNYSTFALGDPVKINIYSYSNNQDKFYLRLLKIENPVQFFTLLDQNSNRYAFDIWGKDKSTS